LRDRDDLHPRQIVGQKLFLLGIVNGAKSTRRAERPPATMRGDGSTTSIAPVLCSPTMSTAKCRPVNGGTLGGGDAARSTPGP
jgi:hypothetical protein